MITEQQLSLDLQRLINNPADNELVKQFGIEDLKTKSKTIKEAINEIYEDDKNQKDKVIKVLKDNDITVSNDIDNIILNTIKKITGPINVDKKYNMTFEQDKEQERSQNTSIDNLVSVNKVTVDNGKVTHSEKGNTITINVSDGDPIKVYKGIDNKTVTDKIENYTGEFPESIDYDKEGYKGVLYKDGGMEFTGIHEQSETKYVEAQDSSSYNKDGYSGNLERYVYSGSYTPSDSKEVTEGYNYIASLDNKPPSTIQYNNNGYSGTLSLDKNKPSESYNKFINAFLHDDKVTLKDLVGTSINLNYTGIVTRPESDTRVYKYRGTVTKPGKSITKYVQKYKGNVAKGDIKEITEIRTSPSDNFDDSIVYNNNEYMGKLLKDGDSYISSGSYTPSDSKTETDTKFNSSNSFDESISYNSGGYNGTLYKDGNSFIAGEKTAKEKTKYIDNYDSAFYSQDGYVGYLEKYVANGSYIPSESKTETVTEEVKLGQHADVSKNYDKAGYKGILYIDYEKTNESATDASASKKEYYTAYYSGPVTREASDGRIYKYKGTVVLKDSSASTKYIDNYDSAYYSQDGYTGSLDKYVVSGECIPRDSKKVGKIVPVNLIKNSSLSEKVYPDIYYDQDGYKGNIKITNFEYIQKEYTEYLLSDLPSIVVYAIYEGTVTKLEKDTREYKYRGFVKGSPTVTKYGQNYKGTVTKPSSDTRIYSQKYKGNITKNPIIENNYKYEVTIQATIKD